MTGKWPFFFKDITRRKENEFSNAWLGAIIDSSNDAIISKDLNGKITNWNRSAERLFGYTAEEAIGRNITLIIPEERLDEEVDILKRIKRGEQIDHFETVREYKDGFRLDISLTISPIKNSGDEIIDISKIARDITKQKQVKKELRELNETLEERVEKRTEELQDYQLQLRSLASELSKAEEQERYRLASELHNNLGQMLAIAKMKIEDIEQSDLSTHLADEIADLSELMNNAINYTRELMTELKPPPALDKEEVREVLDWVAKEMKKYDLEVYISEDEESKPLTEEHRSILYQCVRELLMNVVKYADVNEARILLSRVNNFVRITVEDEGKGFDVNEKSPMPTKEGGFGLFNIRERIDWIGGRFKLISEPGEGTKAILYVAVKEKEKEQYEVPEKEVKKVNLTIDERESRTEESRKLKILIADDHQMVRKGFRQMIEKQEQLMVVAEASSGEESIRLARETNPDVILWMSICPVLMALRRLKYYHLKLRKYVS